MTNSARVGLVDAVTGILASASRRGLKLTFGQLCHGLYELSKKPEYNGTFQYLDFDNGGSYSKSLEHMLFMAGVPWGGKPVVDGTANGYWMSKARAEERRQQLLREHGAGAVQTIEQMADEFVKYLPKK
jgi:hypothetical protein